MNFLSPESVSMHKEHLRTLKLRLSVFEESYPEVKGYWERKSVGSHIDRREMDEMKRLKAEITAHEVYFDSFVIPGAPCHKNEYISSLYGSEANFLYGLLDVAGDKTGFLILYFDKQGKIGVYAGNDYSNVILRYDCPLAVDLCEHAYFLDYGFNREKYISAALSNLNLSRLRPKNILQNRIENGKIKQRK